MPEAAHLADDEIEFLYEKKPFKCQFCMKPIANLSPEERNSHYIVHLDEQDRAASSSTLQKTGPDKENIFWFSARTSRPPKNFTPGLISVLKRVLTRTHAKGFTTRAVLCHDGITHVATELWDAGWGCGYRNFLMACSALMNQPFQPTYFALLDDDTRPPGVRNLQHWIENAWADGFDREGAEQLKHKVVKTRKWIGTGELYVAFTWRGIPAQLIDFPGSDRGPVAIIQWIINYFSAPNNNTRPADAFDALKGASPIIVSEKMPLILQHAGHSRTIIGYELNKKGEPNLLIFDPSYRPSEQLRRVALAIHSSSSFSSPNKRHDASSVMSRVFRIDKGNIAQKRPSWDNVGGERTKKRIRGDLQGSSSRKDDDVIVIEDDSGQDAGNTEDREDSLDGLDPIKVLSTFRVNQTKLAKKDRYQILCFPLDAPLEEHERWHRRAVTSEIVV